MNKPVVILSALLCSLCSCALSAAEQAGVAYVVVVSGEATVIHEDGSQSRLERRSEIQAGDRIATGPESWLQLRFADAAILSLSCNSSLLVKEYQYLDQNDDRSQLHLESGRARTITGTIQRSTTRFTARNLIISPSGTDYEVMIDEDDNFFFAVYDGAIRIESLYGELTLGAAQQAQYARMNTEIGLEAMPLRPAQLGNGVLGGIECP